MLEKLEIKVSPAEFEKLTHRRVGHSIPVGHDVDCTGGVLFEVRSTEPMDERYVLAYCDALPAHDGRVTVDVMAIDTTAEPKYP